MSTEAVDEYTPPITEHQRALALQPCARPCTVCEGADHHWMPDCEEETGLPWMVCKHCEARRPYIDEDDDI